MEAEAGLGAVEAEVEAMELLKPVLAGSRTRFRGNAHRKRVVQKHPVSKHTLAQGHTQRNTYKEPTIRRKWTHTLKQRSTSFITPRILTKQNLPT